MRERYAEYEVKEKKANELKEYCKLHKRVIVGGELRKYHLLGSLTEIITTLIELEQKYLEAKILQLDSVVDSLIDGNEGFYKLSHSLNENFNELQEVGKKLTNKKCKDDESEALINRFRILKIKRKAILAELENTMDD